MSLPASRTQLGLLGLCLGVWSGVACGASSDGDDERAPSEQETRSNETDGSETEEDDSGESSDRNTDSNANTSDSDSGSMWDYEGPECDCLADEYCVADCGWVPGIDAPPTYISQVRCVPMSVCAANRPDCENTACVAQICPQSQMCFASCTATNVDT